MPLCLVIALVVVAGPPETSRAGDFSAGKLQSVIVRELPGSSDVAEQAVIRAGGTVGRHIDIIDAFVADVPAGAVAAVANAPGVHSVSENRVLNPLGHVVDGFDQRADAGSMWRSLRTMRVHSMWNHGYSGKGVDIALIDSGVSPVDGLSDGNVINGPDLSFESQADNLRYLDGYGHGTHMAGIIVGKDDAADAVDVNSDGDFDDDEGKCVDLNGDGDWDDVEAPPADLNGDGDTDDPGEAGADLNGDGDYVDVEVFGSDLNGDGDCYDKDVFYGALVKHHFVGVAPEARVVNVKVGTAHGTTDVSQVLAAIDWIVQNRNSNGMNIRVLNLSFGTDGVQNYRIDPLTYAAEVAWRHGIVVVVAAGNSQFGTAKLNNPAYDPFVIAVGADNTLGTKAYKDDEIASFSARGSVYRHPDLVAPGKSIVGLRTPMSRIDQDYPSARVGATPRFFKGSGTSQAAAFVSGAAALLLEQRPGLTPDRLKHLLMATAHELPNADQLGQGEGLVNLKLARDSAASGRQDFDLAIGTGSIEAARGSAHVVDEEGNALEGEVDIFGAPWDGATWAVESLDTTAWSNGYWNGHPWTGDCFCTDTWAGPSWTHQVWSDPSWSGRSWSGRSWSASTWMGRSWSGDSWIGNGDTDNTGLTGRSWSSGGWK
jgi:hypothetical protein